MASYKAACVIFGWSQDKLYRWAKEGKIPASKVGGVWLFNTDDLHKYIRENQCQFSKEVVEKAMSQEQSQIQPQAVASLLGSTKP